MISIIQGGIAKDERGSIRFVNDFNMSEIKRFYVIENKDLNIIRGWRGHRIEKRWFYVLTGAFVLNVVKIDDWCSPLKTLPIEKVIISSEDQQVVMIPEGLATSFQAISENSTLLVFANFEIQNAVNDDYVWPSDYFLI